MTNYNASCALDASLILGDPMPSMLSDPRFGEAQALADVGRTSDALDIYARIGVRQGETISRMHSRWSGVATCRGRLPA